MPLLTAELAILTAAAALVLGIALKAPFRRDLRELPRHWVVLGAIASAAAVAVGVWLLVRWPTLRHVTTGLCLVAMIAAWVRARAGYGAVRGWPRGSLGIGKSLNAIYDRNYYLDQTRLHGPVFKMSQFGRPVVCVLGLARARDLLSGQAQALAGAALPYNRALPKGALRYMGASEHRSEGPIFRNAFGTLDLARSEAAVRRSVITSLDALCRASATMPGGVPVRPYLEAYLLEALSLTFFGLEPHDARVQALGALIPATEIGRIGWRAWRRRLEAAFHEGTEIMRSIARDASAGTVKLPLGTALNSVLAADPAALDDVTRARNLFVVFRLANGDVAGLLDWVFAELSQHPAWQNAVRETPRVSGEAKSAQPTDLASRVVLETLRLEQSEFLYRRVVQPLTVDGFRIPPGWLLRILVHESHRDPEVFPDPDRFDPDRFLLRTYDKTEYSPFGADVHGCMGARLTMYLGRLFVEELCHGYHWQVTRDGPLERGTRHRHHWRPSALRRVAMHRWSGAADEADSVVARSGATKPNETGAPHHAPT